MILSLSILLNVGFLAALVIARYERGRLHRLIERQGAKIIILENENVEIALELRRYTGAWNSIAPKKGKVETAFFYFKAPSVQDQIDDMTKPGKVGG